MFKLIKEDNRSIQYYVQTLDSKIVDLKNKLPGEYLEAIHNLYLEAVLPWINNFQFPNIEPTPEQEEVVVNRILDFYNWFNFKRFCNNANRRILVLFSNSNYGYR